MKKSRRPAYVFGLFHLDPIKRILLKEGAPVPLPPRVFDTLLVLVENGGRVLDKDKLMDILWPDTVVEEGNLKVNISHLRKALGENANSHEYIVTIPGRGYRFVADVTEVWEEGVELILQRESTGRIVVEEEDGVNGRIGVGAYGSNRQSEPSHPLPYTQRPTRLHARFLHLLLVAFAVGLAATIGYIEARRGSERDKPSLVVKSIAVLPFKPLRSEESDEYLGLGMADTLITKLSSIRQLVVRPTGAVLKYAGPGQDPLGAGREQRVDAVLEGTIQRSGDRIRLAVRLLNVADGSAIWAYQCDEYQCANIFAAQDAISEQVTRALLFQLNGQERKQLAKRHTENREAYQSYAKGVYFWNLRTGEGANKALAYFQQAINLDPDFALAHAAVANVYNGMIWFPDMPQSQAIAGARQAAARALKLDDTLAEAHAAMSAVYRNDWDWSRGLWEAERAIELSPGSAEMHHWYAYRLIQMGRAEEAVAEMKYSLELDPLNIPINVDVGEILLYARRYHEAIDTLEKALELDPNRYNAHYDLALAYEQERMFDEAIAEHLKVEAIKRNNPQAITAYKAAYAASGMRGFWQEKLERQLEDARRGDVSPVYTAQVYARLSRNTEAFEWLERAYQEHSPNLTDLRVNPMFDPLRRDPRFSYLLQRVGLPH